MFEIPDDKKGDERIDAVILDEELTGSEASRGCTAKVLKVDGAFERYLSENKSKDATEATLQMSELQNRLDAEFLLAQMCSVKFKEWIVVLATLLQRSEVLYDIFRYDLRLWKAYSMTLQSHLGFAQYHDLLQILEDKLSATVGEESNRDIIIFSSYI
ncbi:PREDICTED: uncharacterized protein LOC104758281 [Camelina sativa]|uniref:Uncharacterized protein LOC104758281 n=1 Tax=Camelina sativa TaxID=90675 RepID=A0ABM1R6P4_CAMSA|nr:PREDICTED: uncharacterized protein LOC104758281 [Camelina sativa]XP_010479413.1 PREDICTED: uncharacterized protein LOC104758281 [Camelina sativa]XP_010479414.1 PREDICTED: uncharacterized protein LOC104758281 [Camelina sativa]XP_010479415.1 PREDICTED: uncharacterized protein LOC104758281 [Camelina sativa]XP_019094682.1 PREDICTED: uncharacterized protein LOC104758281 [Camelina sativa]